MNTLYQLAPRARRQHIALYRRIVRRSTRFTHDCIQDFETAAQFIASVRSEKLDGSFFHVREPGRFRMLFRLHLAGLITVYGTRSNWLGSHRERWAWREVYVVPGIAGYDRTYGYPLQRNRTSFR